MRNNKLLKLFGFMALAMLLALAPACGDDGDENDGDDGDAATKIYIYEIEATMGDTVSVRRTIIEDRAATVYHSPGGYDEYIYNDRNKLARWENDQGDYRVYTYDKKGRLAKIDYSDGGRDVYEYNLGGKVSNITDEAGDMVSFVYNKSGNLKRADYHYLNQPGADWFMIWTYDAQGKLVRTSISTGTYVNYIYAEGKLARMVDNNDNWVEFTYNDRGLLLRKVYKSGLFKTYQWKRGNARAWMPKDLTHKGYLDPRANPKSPYRDIWNAAPGISKN